MDFLTFGDFFFLSLDFCKKKECGFGENEKKGKL